METRPRFARVTESFIVLDQPLRKCLLQLSRIKSENVRGHNPEDLPFSASARPRIRQHFSRHWGAMEQHFVARSMILTGIRGSSRLRINFLNFRSGPSK